MFENELFYRLMFALLVIAVLGIRSVGHLRAGTLQTGTTPQPRRSYNEGLVTYIARPLVLFIAAGTLVYLVAPDLMRWSSLPFPDWLRLLGVPLGVLVVVGMAWVHSSLSKYFSGKLQVREDHALITHGPYRWVRHPMYTAVLALFLAVFLLTANWFIGIGGLVVVGAVIFTRTSMEEIMLVETFGDAYREYMERTPRYLPRLFR